MKIWVPGTVTSLVQPAFAFAIDRGVTVTVGPAWYEWEVAHADPTLPHDESNLIVAVAQTVAPGLEPHQLSVASTLPTGMGLGSSLAATLAGVSLASALGDHPLSENEQIAHTAFFEPDELAIRTALAGGGLQQGETGTAPLSIAGLQGAVYLPTQVPAVAVPARPTLAPPAIADLLAAMQRCDGTWLRRHFPLEAQVTASYYPHAEMVSRAVVATGGFACFASGNGPALICLAPAALPDFLVRLRERLTAGTVLPLTISAEGLSIRA
ncbi:GHMP family kinase ATP-binding protein [Lacticaseibacillus suihuaensis]